ncbi:hypothetical protein LCY76_07090 [Fictibacillus sp. KIGAM418]|uniref:Uncharacterized protein n=1 Tax=Fictibacillus marinisediminis TaxID=2878389 RepID=A0A9X2BBZ0_9BACL|nr:hypothetical protein [Fictibacillus marinisediminis]MCK6256359.1 hypothetical protein [Fictibacillus marinisediminis]
MKKNAEYIGRILASLSLAVMFAFGFSHPVEKASAATPPPSATSFYMDTVDTVTLYDMGYQKGQEDYRKSGAQNSMVILDFGGQPSPASLSLFGMPDATLNQVAAAVEAYSRGYWKGTASDSQSMVHVIVGTNNSYTVTYEGAQNFANMIDNINSHNLSHSYSDQVEVDGGNDMEPGYDPATTTKEWVKGYDSVNSYSLYNYGSADGCYHTNLNTGTTNYSCNNGWTYKDIQYISWGASPSWPLPEIYDNSGDMAVQWQNIAKYSSVTSSSQMKFSASLTQAGACADTGCHWELDNTPTEGWNQLYNELSSDTKTAAATKYPIQSTDIRWH